MILDTNGLSAIADGEPKLEALLLEATKIAIAVIVLGEYRYGIRQSRHRIRYERWLAQVIENCKVLAVDNETATKYAEVRDGLKRRGRPIPSNDIWISALARQHALPVLSRDEHFDLVPKLKRLTW